MWLAVVIVAACALAWAQPAAAFGSDWSFAVFEESSLDEEAVRTPLGFQADSTFEVSDRVATARGIEADHRAALYKLNCTFLL